MSRQILIALLFLFASSSTPAAEGDDLGRATDACAMGAFAFMVVAETLVFDINTVDSDQGREAYLAQIESWGDQRHETPTFKAIWLLSLSDALSQLRHNLETDDRAAQRLHDVPAARIKQLRAASWSSASNKLAEVCMFRAGKLAGQGKL